MPAPKKFRKPQTPARPSIFVEPRLAKDITGTILALAAPLFGGRTGDALPDEELERGVHLAILAWNAGTPRVPAGTIEWGYEQAEETVGGERWAFMRPFFDDMLAARREVYGDDPRLVVRYELVDVPGRGRRLDLATSELKKPQPS